MGNNNNNGYASFVYHTARMRKRNNQPIRGNPFIELGPEWKKLTDQEKLEWKNRSKSNQRESHDSTMNSNPPASPSSPDNKLSLKRQADDDGKESMALAQVQKRHCLKPGRSPPQYCDFKLLQLRDQCDSIIRSRDDRLITTPIYSISTNVLCKCKSRTDASKEIYIPLEISICANTIREGAKGFPFQALIDAGDIPPNYYNKSRDHAKIHKISIPSEGYPENARNDYRKIYKQMLEYTEEGEHVLLVPDHRDIDQVKGCLEWLHERAKEENPNKRVQDLSRWTILPLVDFIALTYNSIYLKTRQQHVTKFIHYYIKLKLDGCLLDHMPSMMCKYHKDNQTEWCAQACAKKAFMNLAEIFGIICQHHDMCQVPRNAIQQGGFAFIEGPSV